MWYYMALHIFQNQCKEYRNIWRQLYCFPSVKKTWNSEYDVSYSINIFLDAHTPGGNETSNAPLNTHIKV